MSPNGIDENRHFYSKEIGLRVAWSVCRGILSDYPREPNAVNSLIFNQRFKDKLAEMKVDSEDLIREMVGEVWYVDKDTGYQVPGWSRWYLDSIPSELLNSTEGVNLLKRFLTERGVVQPLKESLLSNIGGIPSNFEEKLKAAQSTLTNINSGSSPIQITSSFNLSTLSDDSAGEPTNIPWLDAKVQENSTFVGCLIAYTGVGKSTMLRQLAAEKAIFYQMEAKKTGVLKHAFYATYEPSMTGSIATRLLASYLGRIDQTKALAMRSPDDLTACGKLARYEEIMYDSMGINDPALRLGERERFEKSLSDIGWLGDKNVSNLHILDMSAGEVGTGGIQELAEQVQRISDQLKVVPGSIYIDHLSEVVRRKFRVGAQLNVEEAITRRAYTDFPQQCATLLAAPASKGGLGCKVWYAHQAKGAVANYRPVDLPSNTWSEGCTSIAENNVFTMVFGIPSVINELRNMGVINDDLMRFNPAVLRYNITKCRFNMPVPSYGLLARYSAICRFDCGDSEYVVSESTRELISRRDSDVGNSRQNRPRITRTAVQLPGGSF
jgi:hypothetical protein